MNEKLKFEREYAAPVEAVWDAITTGEALGEWFMRGSFTAEEGFQFSFAEPGLSVRGEVLEVVKQERLTYSWVSRHDEEDGEAGVPSVVSWTLSPTPTKGTRVTLDHQFLAAAQPIVTIEAAVNWAYALHSTLAVRLSKYAPPAPIVYVTEDDQPSPSALPRAGFRQPEEVFVC